jgi:hypothetical protein
VMRIHRVVKHTHHHSELLYNTHSPFFCVGLHLVENLVGSTSYWPMQRPWSMDTWNTRRFKRQLFHRHKISFSICHRRPNERCVWVCELFVEGSHHRNLSVACIMQNAFSKGKENRTMSINTQYIVLFKNPRSRSSRSSHTCQTDVSQ